MAQGRRDEECSVTGCVNPHWTRGLCNSHYYRLRRWGEVRPEIPLRVVDSPVDRLLNGLPDRPSDGCWEWTKTVNNAGYGQISVNGRQEMTHRVAYVLWVGPIPDGMQLDHLCRNRPCCNPAHLEPVTPRENYLRGESVCAQNARKTHCPRGHEYDEANTYVDKAGSRNCRACDREDKRAKRHVDREHHAGRLDILGLGLLLADDSPLVPLTERGTK